MAKVTVDRFIALAIRRGFITRAQLEAALKELGLRASLDRESLVRHLLATGAITPAKLIELEKLLKRRDLYCSSCHSVVAIENYSPQRDYECPACNGPMRRPDGLDTQTKLRIEDIFREIGPDPAALERTARFGRYRLIRPLGRGAMGVVYLGTDERLHRTVAIKVIPDDLAGDDDLLRRFQREARSLAKLRHPNIVQIYDVDSERGRNFIVMEYVDGPALDTVIRTAGRIAPKPAAKFSFDVALALQHTHREGIVHRDVKPGNILITKGGIAKLSDFGLSRGATDGSTTITLSGLVLGTPHYISPEGAEGRAVDIRSDVYSLGVTMYHMLAGFRPFEGRSALAVLVQHIDCMPPALPADVPGPLAKLVMSMLEKSPGKRPQGAPEVLRALKAILL